MAVYKIGDMFLKKEKDNTKETHTLYTITNIEKNGLYMCNVIGYEVDTDGRIPKRKVFQGWEKLWSKDFDVETFEDCYGHETFAVKWGDGKSREKFWKGFKEALSAMEFELQKGVFGWCE